MEVRTPLLNDHKVINDYHTRDNVQKQKSAMTSYYRKSCIGFILLVIVNILDSVTVIASQLALAKTSVFELSILRYFAEAIFALLFILSGKYSWKLEWSSWKLLLGASIGDFGYGIGSYVAATYLPVGTTQGIAMSLYILLTVIIDIFKKHARKSAIICALISCSGILLLTQPWELNMRHGANDCIPCDVLDGVIPPHNVSYCQVNRELNNTWTNYDGMEPTSSNRNYVNGPHNKEYIGYILVVVAALSASVSSNCCKHLVSKYAFPPALLWTALMETGYSAVLTAIIKLATGSSWALPDGKYCLTFAWVFVITTALNDMFWYITFTFLPVSSVSLGTSPTVLWLYISQRTFLKSFYPGFANHVEVLGASLAFLGAAFMPLIDLCHSKYKSRQCQEILHEEKPVLSKH